MAKKKTNARAASTSSTLSGAPSRQSGNTRIARPKPAESDYEKEKVLRSPLREAVVRIQDIWLWYSGEFSFSMLEPVSISAYHPQTSRHAQNVSNQWEVVLLHTILVAVLGLLYYATTRYLPSHVRFIAGRAQYYLFGNKDSFYVASNSIDEGINRDL